MRLKCLWHHAIRWGNPYTDPPGELPRIIAEVATDNTMSPQELIDIQKKHQIDPGYTMTTAPIAEPPRTMSRDTRSKIRRQRMESRIKSSYPMFADQLIAQDLDDRSEYFDGENDPEREADRMSVINGMSEDVEFYSRHIGELILHVDFANK